MSLVIRPYRADDDVVELTGLLHRAYASLAEQGLRFYASYQTPDMTMIRIAKGRCFVAEDDGRIVGMICLYFPNADSSVPEYRESTTCNFGQFAVEPACRGSGIGRALHEHILAVAEKEGMKYMALDTAVPATDLVAMYARWGYQEIGRTSWSVTNYQSVLMRRPITLARGNLDSDLANDGLSV